MARPVCISTPLAPRHSDRAFGCNMSTGTIVRFAVGVAILVVVASAWLAARAKQERRDLMLVLSMSVGADLVHGTNSQALTGVTPELQSDLKLIHASPTQAIIQPGDDDLAVGDRARARLVLTNDVGQTLTLRLRPESDPSTGLRKFRVIGYRKTEPDGTANRSQPAGSQTNRASGAAGSGG
jgi:hypothetical protein